MVAGVVVVGVAEAVIAVANRYLDVYFGSQRISLAVVIWAAIAKGEGGAVFAREEEHDAGCCCELSQRSFLAAAVAEEELDVEEWSANGGSEACGGCECGGGG